jgi:hypothetical protein
MLAGFRKIASAVNHTITIHSHFRHIAPMVDSLDSAFTVTGQRRLQFMASARSA